MKRNEPLEHFLVAHPYAGTGYPEWLKRYIRGVLLCLTERLLAGDATVPGEVADLRARPSTRRTGERTCIPDLTDRSAAWMPGVVDCFGTGGPRRVAPAGALENTRRPDSSLAIGHLQTPVRPDGIEP